MSLFADIIALTLGLAVGYLTISAARGPQVGLPPIWRFAILLVVASFANGIFRTAVANVRIEDHAMAVIGKSLSNSVAYSLRGAGNADGAAIHIYTRNEVS